METQLNLFFKMCAIVFDVVHCRAKYYASHQQSLTGATTLLVTIFKNYGDPGKGQDLGAVLFQFVFVSHP